MADTRRRIKKYEELTFADDFMFCKVLQSNPELCRELTELILGRKIGSIVRIGKQYPVEITSDGHGVRFDIYMKDDENAVYDIEMQTISLPELPKRARYYHSMMDLDILEKGVSYRHLPGSYVIFICLENPFEKYGLHKYTFTSCCLEDSSLQLKDGNQSIFLSAEGDADDVSDDIKDFLKYLTDQSVQNLLTRRLDDAVQAAKSRREWSVEYMNLYEIRELEREEGRAEGRKEGRAEGRKEGRNDTVYAMVQDGDTSPARGAARLGISEAELRANMIKAGYKWPEEKT